MNEKLKVLAHTCFIGKTGYSNHAKSFFCALNKYHTVKVRNLTIGDTWVGYSNKPHDNEEYLTDEMRGMLILQTLYTKDVRNDYPIYDYDGKYKPDIHIVLNDVDNPYFYDDYEGYKIAYNVWETTRYPEQFFNRLFYFNEVWVPSDWQKNNLIAQGYPADRISVVPEGVDPDIFLPETNKTLNEDFTFLLFGRWEYRKSTQEIIETFVKTFNNNEKVKLIISADNSFATDNVFSAKTKLSKLGLNNDLLEVISYPSREEYVNYLKNGDVFLSCARSEGWNLPLIEAMACGIPSIYSNWGAQLQFAQNKGVPVKVLHEVPAKTQDPSFVGNYIEPDFNDLSKQMMDCYKNYNTHKIKAFNDSLLIQKEFNWGLIAKNAADILSKKVKNYVFITTGNIGYMPVIEQLVKSLNEFSKANIIVYGVDCEIPFDYPNLIKRKISPPFHSEHDKWYWKQYACIESIKEDFDNFVWIDGDVIVNYNIDEIQKYFNEIENYPLSDIHLPREFYGYYYINGVDKSQSFNENLSKLMGVEKKSPYMHICMFIYNKKCEWWFEEILLVYKSIDNKDYYDYLLWNDETIDNVLRCKYNFNKHLPLSNFDTSSYDGERLAGTNQQLNDFYTFWQTKKAHNFNKIYGFQYIPKDKSNILYFHGNKNSKISAKMIEYIKMKRDDNFFTSEQFFTAKDNITNLGEIKDLQGSTLYVAENYNWFYAIYHEIYNLQDYYNNRTKIINKGDVVVDLGGNIGIFNRWACSQGAGKVISFEPDKRYFELLSMNTDPDKSVLFNAAISDKVGEVNLYESDHLGGSNIFGTPSDNKGYKTRTYTLDYLFESGLIDKIDFLKVDIEGSEHLVFNGISDENLLRIKNISMEYHHSHFNFNEELRNKFIHKMNLLGFNSYLLFLGTNNALQMIYFTR